jgi:hypothetical protein
MMLATWPLQVGVWENNSVEVNKMAIVVKSFFI